MQENVNGIVSGPIEIREYYRFYCQTDGHKIWDAGHYNNDQQAITAFWKKFAEDPELTKKYKKHGVEMRVWK